jgi:hypothetical protein
MRKHSSLALVLFASVFYSVPAFAQEAIDCSAACTDGKVMVAYADGNSTSCICTEAAQMDPTIPDPNVQEGEINTGT